jgi:hypothetical protein
MIFLKILGKSLSHFLDFILNNAKRSGYTLQLFLMKNQKRASFLSLLPYFALTGTIANMKNSD